MLRLSITVAALHPDRRVYEQIDTKARMVGSGPGVDTVTQDSKASLTLYGAMSLHIFRATKVYVR